MPKPRWLLEERKFIRGTLTGVVATLCLSWGAVSHGQSRPTEGKPLSFPKVSTLPAVCQASQSHAISDLLKQETLHPTAKGYTSLGVQFAQDHDFRCAVAAYEAALTMDPELWETRYNMGLALVRTSERERAAEQFQLVLLQKPDYFPAHSARGLLLYNLNRLDAAADEFKETLRLNPRDVNAAFDLAKVLHAQRRYTAEIYYLRQGLAWHPPPELAYQMRFALGVAYFQNGNKDDAVDTLRKLEAAYPKASEVHFTLANAYAKDLEVQEAAAEYEATIRLDPDNNPARLSLGNLKTWPDLAARLVIQ